MQEQHRLRYSDSIQKNLTKICFVKCKSIENKQCFDVCYEKYVATVGTVNRKIKQIAYEKHSLIAYKGYPQQQIESQYFHDPNRMMEQMDYPFANKGRLGA